MERKIAYMLICFFLIVTSCEKKTSAPENPPAEGGSSVIQSQPAVSQRPQRTLSFGGSDQKSGGQESSEVVITAETTASMERTRPFFDRAGVERHIPRDRIIGSLLVLPASEGEDAQIYNLALQWSFSLMEKKTDGYPENLYAPESADLAAFMKSTAQSVDQEITGVRFGSIRYENGEARMDVRLFSGIGRVSGEIMFLLTEAGWRIFSEDIDYTGLDTEYLFPDFSEQPELYGTLQM